MKLEKIIGLYVGETRKSRYLCQQLQAIGDVYLLGGIARELYNDRYSREHNGSIQIRDIDIVIDSKDRYRLFQSIMQQYPHDLNKFGGYKFKIDNIKIDIWEIRNTWAYQNNIIRCEKNDMGYNLQKTVFLNYDAVIYYFNENSFYCEKYKECLRNKKIDIVLEMNPEIYLNLLRALEFKVKTGFSLSLNLINLFYQQYCQDINLIKKLYNIECYRKNILTMSDIEQEMEDIIIQYHKNQISY